MQIKKTFYGLKYAISISQEIMKTIEAKHIFKIFDCSGIELNFTQKYRKKNPINFNIIGELRLDPPSLAMVPPSCPPHSPNSPTY